jgi:hypothetical protein
MKYSFLKNPIIVFTLILSFLFQCSSEQTKFPRKDLKANMKPPEIIDDITWSKYMQPVFGKTIERPTEEGSKFYVIFRDSNTNFVVRSVMVQLEERNTKLEPAEYLHYPVSYMKKAANNSIFLPSFNMYSDVYRNNYRPYVTNPGYGLTAGMLVVVIGGIFVVGTTGGFLLGLGKGTYELTEDLWEGFTIDSREIVVGYNDYSYDESGTLVRVASYLPYRAVTKTILPVYNLEGTKEVGTLYPESEPILIYDLNYIFPKQSKGKPTASAVNYRQLVPTENQKRIPLPIKK